MAETKTLRKAPGRKPGLYLHTEGFEALISAKNILRKDVAIDCGFTPQFISDLCAHRGGASESVASELARSLGVSVAALFPERAEHPWVSPLPDRNGKREGNKTRVRTAA